MGGNDLEQRQYLEEKRNGITTDDFATWKGKKAAEAAGDRGDGEGRRGLQEHSDYRLYVRQLQIDEDATVR